DVTERAGGDLQRDGQPLAETEGLGLLAQRVLSVLDGELGERGVAGDGQRVLQGDGLPTARAAAGVVNICVRGARQQVLRGGGHLGVRLVVAGLQQHGQVDELEGRAGGAQIAAGGRVVRGGVIRRQALGGGVRGG